ELWQILAEAEGRQGERAGSVHDQPWPEFDVDIAREDTITIPVQVNGKVKAELEVERGTGKKELEEMAMENEKISAILDGKEPKKIIVVPDKIINIVI
ncbi:MAG: hypothetical protein R3251_04630, partial [Candidatus Spechtbacterales bacterium]|nr:hypothetical protein [Candidatus Spechtbacterales bacterium]